MDGCMDAWMHVCMYVCVSVCYISPSQCWISIDTVYVYIYILYMYIYILYICLYICIYDYVYIYICIYIYVHIFLVQSHVSLVKSQYFHEENHHVWWLNPNESWSIPTFFDGEIPILRWVWWSKSIKIHCFTAEVLQCISKGQYLGLNKSGEASS